MNLTVADQRILRGVTATLSFTNVDGNGTPVDAGGAVTVGVTKAPGGTVLAAGTATAHAANETGAYTVVLTAAQNATLELLTATWTVAGGGVFSTIVEVVGGFFFTTDEVLVLEPDLARYSVEDIIRARQEVEDECEFICDVAFVPRYERATLDGSGTQDLVLLHHQLRTIRSVNVTGTTGTATAFTTDELAALYVEDDFVIHRPAGAWFDDTRRGNVVVEYEHGYDRPPSDLKRASARRLRSRLNAAKSGIPDRATSFAIADGGTYRLDTPGAYKTGIPEVDAVYDRYSRRDQGDGKPRPASRSLDLDPRRYSLFHGGRR